MSTLIGHQARWNALARAFAGGTIPQSLLISGPPHVGKTTFARRYAQLLLCQSPIESDGLPAPCLACPACHQVEIETFPDFRVYRPILSSSEDERDWVTAPEILEGSLISVGQARKFGAEAMMKPLSGARKIMMILQADRMDYVPQNTLLKTFEEPIPGLSIFLLSSSPDLMSATIRSRCWHLPLGLASDGEIADWLRASTHADESQIALAVAAASGRAGAAWREIKRLENAVKKNDGEKNISSTPRLQQAEEFLNRIARSQAVGALGLTEEALRLSKIWWDEDSALETSTRGETKKSDLKKADAKITRTSIARFLDELSMAYRARWQSELSTPRAARWGNGLDQIRKTRHYILRNANANLALDVLFGRLIAS